MKTNHTFNEMTFKPQYYGGQEPFKTTFRQVDNRGGDIEIDEIIIFDGGDVYGYEKENQNCILGTPRA